MPSERAILFSAPMVRAILDGRKTQTRRPVARGNSFISERHAPAQSLWEALDFGCAFVDSGPSPAGNPGPYLRVANHDDATVQRVYSRLWTGDRLWVRETWGQVRMHDLTQHVYCGPRVPDRMQVVYRAGKRMGIPVGSTSPIQFRTEWRDDLQPDRWRPSIHMPRWASRLTLEITDVRVERIQQISEEDAKNEGVEPCGGFMATGGRWTNYGQCGPSLDTPRESYRTLWDSINATRAFGWDANPWVWVMSFRRLGGHDA